MQASSDRPAPPPSSMELFRAFGRIGLTSFGGGLSGWLLREFVQTRHWLPEDEFLSGLALAQAFPGVNVVNMAIWIGYRLRGGRGALAGALGIILPSAVLVVIIGAAFDALSSSRLVRLALEGAGATAIGLSLSMGLVAGRRAARDAISVAVMAAAFAAVGLFKLPVPLVVLVLAPLSVASCYRALPRA